MIEVGWNINLDIIFYELILKYILNNVRQFIDVFYYFYEVEFMCKDYFVIVIRIYLY